MSDTRKAPVTIDVMENGPLIVKGLERLTNSRGEAMPTKASIALCRCGGSQNKPFCDGAHKSNGFSGAREIDKPLDRERDYVGTSVTIHDNRTICAHAAHCVNELESVFKKGGRPWIEPDGDTVEAIDKVIHRCPSGALSYTVDGVRGPERERDPEVRIYRDGPLHMVGRISLNVEEGLQPPDAEQYTLCRCGASKNKPYCDGSHASAGFEDPDN